MVILVDDATWPWRGRVWAHLVSDESLGELHDFADRLGLRREWFQGDHYDVPAAVRDEAIARGAVDVDSRELVRRLRAAGLRRSGARRRVRVRIDALFAGAAVARVVLPRVGPGVAPVARAELEALLLVERAALVAELGTHVDVVRAEEVDDPSDGASLLLRVDPTAEGLALSREQSDLVVVAGRDLEEVTEGLSLLRTARRTGADRVVAAPAADVAGAVALLDAEVATTHPGVGARGVDWASLAAAHRERVDEDDPLPGMQRWVAGLRDLHTTVRRAAPHAALPLTARVVDDALEVVEVAAGTALAEAGVGPGWIVEVADLHDLGRRTGAPPHAHPWAVGRRAVTGTADQLVALSLRAPDGTTRTVEDVAASGRWHDHLQLELLSSGTAVLRLRHWSTDDVDVLDELLAGLAGCERLVVDLRGNPGGSRVAAASFRERFVQRPTTLGSVRHSTGDGGLTSPTAIVATPSARTRWTGRVRFLTDGLTSAASEDAIAGLQQLATVDVVGAATGGGSGRTRTVPLLDGIVLTVSTALTYDHAGRCIEGAGVLPDTVVDLPTGPAGWLAADRDW